MCGSFCDNMKQGGGENRCKKNHNKRAAYAINKQTLEVNSRKIILSPVVYQNRFETFCFLQLHHLQDGFWLVLKS